ncbi:MAG: hypothetical protein CME62_07105 [Halobacteriovoraceae bacterium]|nr:hypothetical protein [Halobacteriovoraceae bacterium]|tara:strand:- start:1524 stop:2234 length:711 start_codon:yes stop_codon:yes gene_type:complete
MKLCILALGRLGKKVYQLTSEKSFGTYTHEEKKGYDCLRFDINQQDIPHRFFDATHIFFNLPPSKIESFENFASLFYKLKDKHWIFISSTSVYGQSGELHEDHIAIPKTENGKFLKKCEELILENDRNIVIRPAGLYDETNHPGQYLAGRENISGGDQPINLISRDEVAQLTLDCVQAGFKGILNAVNTHHPLKESYYQEYCRRHGLDLPHFISEGEPGKTVITKYEQYKIDTQLP